MMKSQFVTDAGNVNISLDVIARYAGMCAVECFGIVGMAAYSMKDGWARLLKKESLSKGINVEIKDGALCFEFHVIVSYGVSIAAVAENLMNNVKYKIEQFTGMKTGTINIYVEGVRVID